MAKVDTLIYCLNVERIPTPDPNNTVINANRITNNFILEYIPSTYSFSVIGIITEIDIETDRTLTLRFKDTNNEVLLDTGSVPFSQLNYVADESLPSEYRGFTLSMDLQNVVIKASGEYTTEVLINDEIVYSKKVYIGSKNES